MDRLGDLARSSWGATGGTLLASFALQVSLMVSGVLAARMLGVEGRGYLALLLLFPYGLAQLVGLGLPLSVTYEVARRDEIAATICRLLTPLAAAQCVLVVILHVGILKLTLFGAPQTVQTAGWLTLGVPPALILQYYCLAILQGEGAFRPYNVLRVLPFALYGAAVAGLFLGGAETVIPLTAGWVAAYAFAVAITLAFSYRRLRAGKRVEPAPSRVAMLVFGLKGVVGWASPSENFRVDQAVIGLLLSPAALGLYVAGQAFANLPRLVAQSMGIVAYQRVASATAPELGRSIMWRYLFATVAICAVVIAILELGAGALVGLFFGSDFAPAVDVMRILLIAALFASARRVLTDAGRGAGYPGLGTVAEVISWLIMLVGFIAFTPLWDAEGVAFAIVLSAAGSLAFLVVALMRSAKREDADATPHTTLRGPAAAEPTS